MSSSSRNSIAFKSASDSQDEMVREIWKAEHIFRELGNQYQFSISGASKLPLLTSSPLHIPADRDFVCLFGPVLGRDLSVLALMYVPLEARALSMQPDPSEPFEALEHLCVETMAHFFRQRATVEPDVGQRQRLFDKAFALYRSVLYSCKHPSLTAVVQDLRSVGEKIRLVCPVPDLPRFSAEGRRLIAHCFAGMALCALMGQQNPVLYASLSSASVGWEALRPLELAAFLRVHLMLVGRFYLGLQHSRAAPPAGRDGAAWEYAVDRMEAVDALLGLGGGTLSKLPVVYEAMTEKIVLPAVLRHGSATMLEREREGLVCAGRWESAHGFAVSMNQRMEQRAAGLIPHPVLLSHIHIVDGRFAERRCACCGVWQSDTASNRLDRCGVCRVAYYCSRACQRQDWPAHKRDCRAPLPRASASSSDE